eukprot:COSAG02_NODE_1060_length_14866_cov_3.131916_15_plen_157_part_00
MPCVRVALMEMQHSMLIALLVHERVKHTSSPISSIKFHVHHPALREPTSPCTPTLLTRRDHARLVDSSSTRSLTNDLGPIDSARYARYQQASCDTVHKALVPGVTPRLTGHNARNAPGILGVQVLMARFYGIRAKETGQNLNEGTQIVSESYAQIE